MITVLFRKIVYITCLIVGCLPSVFATHIIGGEINYACLGNHQYEISLTVYRDCYLGEAKMDDTAYVAVYDLTGLLVQTVPILLGEIDTVYQQGDCLFVPPDICVETTVYVDTITLLPKTGGYHIAYQRCCRNATILNIINPLNTGATYEIRLTEEAMQACNNSPKIKAWPPTFICVNKPLLFDHSAIDKEGDSLVYSLCAPFEGGISLINPRPRPAYPPPYQKIRWKKPTYDLENVLGGLPLTIDASNGLLEGTPNTIGQFVVGVCIEEYRNGILLSTTKRDFQYNIIPCQEITAAFSLPEQQCENTPITPIQQSIGMNSLVWKFMKDQELLLTSTEIQPNFQALESGEYTIRLIIKSEQECVDSVEQSITIIENNLDADFEYQFTGCQEDLVISLFNTSPSSTVFTQWTLIGGLNNSTSLELNPIIEIEYESNLSIQLEIINEVGCKKELQKTIETPTNLSFKADIEWTVDNCQSNSFDLTVKANTAYPPSTSWQWSLSNGMASNDQQPTFQITENKELELSLVLTNEDNSICESEITALIPAQLLATNITTSEDLIICEENTNIELYAYGDHIEQQWWLLPNGDTISEMAEFSVTIQEPIEYLVELKDGVGCLHQRSISMDYHPIVLQYEPISQLCIGDQDTLAVQSMTPYDLIFSWKNNDQPLVETSNQLVVTPSKSTTYQFEAQSELGCTLTGTIQIEVGEDLPEVEILSSQSTILAGDEIELSTTDNSFYHYQWSPPELVDNPNSATTTAYPIENTLFQLIVTNEEGCTAVDTKEVKVVSGKCEHPFIFLPSAFTPNGDGENDILYVRGQVLKEVQLIIYDRWGDKIFESNSQEIGWDGTKNGKAQPSGVYGYYLFAGCINETAFYKQGNITLIR